MTSLSEAIELFLGAFKLVLVNEWSNLALIIYFVNTPTVVHCSIHSIDSIG